MTPEQQKFVDIKQTTDYKEIGDDLDYKVYTDDQKKEVVLLFEETDSDRDWANNFSILPWPLKLDDKIVWTTHGYARIYASGENQPVEEFLAEAAKHLDYKLCIRGFSLGSAMAKIAARHLIIRFQNLQPNYTIDELTTYGDVKCWLNPFFSLKGRCGTIREYRNINDFVTWCVPFYWRDVRTRVGGKFRLKDILNTPWFHANYETYDYTEYEEAPQ